MSTSTPKSANLARKTTAAPQSPVPRPDTTQVDGIRVRAFQIFQARQAKPAPGDATSDWLQAEREASEARSRERGESLLRSSE